MDVIKVKADSLVLTEDNVRIHPKNQIEEYKRSLNMYGQTKNAVIDENNKVLIGNGLVLAAKELGWEEIAVVRRVDLTENQKLKLMVSDNKIYGLGIDNLDVVEDIFQRLIGDLDIPGYDEDLLKNMVADAEKVTESVMQYGSLNASEIAGIQNRAPAEEGSTEPRAAAPLAEENQTDAVVSAEPAPVNGENGMSDKISVRCPKCGEDIWLLKDALRQLLS